MTADKPQGISTMTTRQKVTAIAVIIVLGIVIWQIVGLFSGGSKPTLNKSAAVKNGIPNGSQVVPQPASLTAGQGAMTTRETQLMQLQQETQAKYLAAINDLQVLKVQRDIAETNQAIMSAKLSAVQSQKKMVDILAPPSLAASSANYAKNLVNPVATPTAIPTPEATYTVVSVSQLQYRWSAVIGSQGNLYSVHVGDVLPADGAIVISIDKSGVVLEKNGGRKRISLVPLI